MTGQHGLRAEEPASSAELPATWDGESAVSIEELKRDALAIAELLDHASARVDQLADRADPSGTDPSETDPLQPKALLSALHQELALSRQWNSHLTSILTEVVEARRALDIREQKAAAEIFELTSAVEDAQRELQILRKSLQPKRSDLEKKRGVQGPNASSRRPDADGDEIRAIAEALAGPDASVDDARRALDAMGRAQMTAAGDLEVVRARIIDALHVVAPHRRTEPGHDGAQDHDAKPSDAGENEAALDDGLSSEDITAWAASITSKLHHESLGETEAAYAALQAIALRDQPSPPDIEAMRMQREARSTMTVRAGPHDQAPMIATIRAGRSLLVTGKVIDRNWYRVEIEGGRHGFIAGDMLKPPSLPMPPASSRAPS